MSSKNKSDRTQLLKFKACDISVPLPISPEPNTIYVVKDNTEFEFFPVDADGNYLTLKHPDFTIPSGTVFGSELNVFNSSAITSNSTDVFQDVINDTTTSLSVGKYAIKVSYSWNANCTQHDFESRLRVNGLSIVADTSGVIHREEPKDSGGQWNGTNSLQILHFSREYTIDFTTAGARTIELAFRSSKDNIMSSIWDVDIKIYRIN